MKGCRQLKRKARKRGEDFNRNDDYDSEPSTVQVIALSSNTRKELMIPVITKRLTAAQINEAIGERLAWNTILYTDKHDCYSAFANQSSVHLKQVLSSDHVHKKDPRINVQRVNTMHSHFKTFLRKFDGVSTKYLVNYINWFQNLEKKASNTVSFIKNFILEILMNYDARFLYKQFKAK